MTMHTDQVPVGPGMVSTLIADQFPQWADLEVTELRTPGTVNAVFRLGEELLARLPLRAEAGGQVAREVAAAAELLGRSRFATPEVLATGVPGPAYPHPWTVVRWIDGTPADTVEVSENSGLARDLAEFVGVVRDLPLNGRRFRGTGRGGDLHRHDAWMAECFERSEELLDVPVLRDLWSGFRRLPHVSADVMTHGDLIPGNLLLQADRLVGVLDVGQLAAADPAVDLIVGWHLFDAETREQFRSAVHAEELDWVRSQAWAFCQAMGLVWYYDVSNPAMSSLGRRTLDRIARDPLV